MPDANSDSRPTADPFRRAAADVRAIGFAVATPIYATIGQVVVATTNLVDAKHRSSVGWEDYELVACLLFAILFWLLAFFVGRESWGAVIVGELLIAIPALLFAAYFALLNYFLIGDALRPEVHFDDSVWKLALIEVSFAAFLAAAVRAIVDLNRAFNGV